ncbi:hypothetical protein SAMN05444008_108112 [Cnuella takakiae]|uniref:DUF4440 domain-containing protein n=1 Tax=Cnuella takakiae TaxID=1302690 RepID=A0A1M5BVA4_9BACT|nr:nuclear transport factor 2 family protein [Cnuella takakiae]OLY93530.1 hypothetical protein BUE76_17825 [Cnuella takakiae]SHF46459.1 hypothetical protein SAMN05444008_108112 [Cnuella takakiae]
MKLLFAIVLLFAAPCCRAQSKGPEQAIVRFFDGLALLNDTLIRENTTPDFLLLEHGEVWNCDTLLRRIAPLKGRTFKRVNEFKFIRTEQQGNTAWLAYDNKAYITVNNQQRTVHWLESATLKYNQGKWRIALLHSTRLPE